MNQTLPISSQPPTTENNTSPRTTKASYAAIIQQCVQKLDSGHLDEAAQKKCTNLMMKNITLLQECQRQKPSVAPLKGRKLDVIQQAGLIETHHDLNQVLNSVKGLGGLFGELIQQTDQMASDAALLDAALKLHISQSASSEEKSIPVEDCANFKA